MSWLARVLDVLFLAVARRHPFVVPWLQAVIDHALVHAQESMENPDVSTLRTEILKFWPIFASICGAIYYIYQGEPSHALAALGLGTTATLSGDALHREPAPAPTPVSSSPSSDRPGTPPPWSPPGASSE